jgi:4-amino-4-deoxy-L-arabinose transferase-like glycosyltransferase
VSSQTVPSAAEQAAPRRLAPSAPVRRTTTPFERRATGRESSRGLALVLTAGTAVLPFLALTGMAAFFGWWYGHYLFKLPLFGDAANHARIAREFLKHGTLNTPSPYPPLYHSLGALGLAVGGEDGFIALTLISVIALGILTYFLAREVTGSSTTGLVAALIAYVSPKTAFYGGRLYMEVFLAVLFLAAFLFLHRYLRLGKRRDLVLCAFAGGLAAMTKQQGLLLLAVPLAAFLPAYEFLQARRWQRHVRRFEFTIVPLVLAVMVVPTLLWQIRNTGAFLPESDYTNGLNSIARAVVGYRDNEPAWHATWDDYLDAQFIDAGYYKQGSVQAEKRHVWPWQALITERGFVSIHSLFWRSTPGGTDLPVLETDVLTLLFAAGLGLWFVSHRTRPFVVFLGIFLLLNYAAFIRNNDQVRYHLFISYILAFGAPFALQWLFGRTSRISGILAVLGLAVFVGAFAYRYLPARTEYMTKYESTQAYAPSAGGIESIKEVAAYIDKHSSPGESFYAIPDTEFGYYSRRKAVFDYRIYFLSSGDLARVLADMGVSYVVLPKSATLPDDQWIHLFKAPASFGEKLKELYPVAFNTSARDITVYQVKGELPR